jgi:hypothetical protein
MGAVVLEEGRAHQLFLTILLPGGSRACWCRLGFYKLEEIILVVVKERA